MGLLIEGQWHSEPLKDNDADGEFRRRDAAFRNWVTADGEAGPTGEGGFRAEPGRYHLYVSLACPWASRTLMLRRLKQLEDVIDVTVTDPYMLENGWEYPDGEPNYGYRCHHQLYTAARSDYSGRATVPVLWDKHRGTIVSNESAHIVRMLNDAFDAYGNATRDFCPAAHRAAIDRVNAEVYENVNNGVYKAGFATTQRAYERAFDALFRTLDALETRLAESRYLVANRFTEADVRLFTTLVRFDAVYYLHFKCNLHRIADYPHLFGYLRDIFQIPGISDTVSFAHIKQHYYGSHREINPTGIIPKGPALDLSAPHARGALGPAALDSAGRVGESVSAGIG